MAGFLSETTRDWLTIIGTVLAVLQTLLALGIRSSDPKRTSEAFRREVDAKAQGTAVARFASKLGVSERAIWITIVCLYPGATLLVMAMFALAPLPPGDAGVLVKDDAGLIVFLAELLHGAQGFFGFVLGLMLASEQWGIEDEGFIRLPRRVLLLLGSAGALSLYLALEILGWASRQPVGWGPRFAGSAATACVFPAILSMMGCLIGFVEPSIDRWMERVK